MLNLITQIVLCLLAAMLLGFVLGWLGHKLFGNSGISEEEHNALRARLNESRDKSATHEASLKECNETQTRMRSELAAANARAADMETMARKAESDARSHAKLTSKAKTASAVAAPLVKKTVVKKQTPSRKAAPKKTAKPVAKKAAPAKRKPRKKPALKLDKKDDLKLISGIGPVIEKRLNKLGVTHFHHVSKFSKADIKRVGEAIEFFPDRITRDDWKAQAGKFHKEKYGRKP